MSHPSHAPRRPIVTRTSPSDAPREIAPSPGLETLSGLTVRDLIAELASVEESLHAIPALIARRHALMPNPARRPLLRRERAIVGELAARRDQRRLLGA